MFLRLALFFVTIALCWSCSSSEEKPSDEKSKHTTEQKFLGYWHVYNDEGNSFYIAVNPDGTASNTWNKASKGTWEVVDGKILLRWDDGWKDLLFSEDGRFKKFGYNPGLKLEEPPSSKASADKVGSIPAQQ